VDITALGVIDTEQTKNLAVKGIGTTYVKTVKVKGRQNRRKNMKITNHPIIDI
jgi:hypothetical protein